MRVMIDLETMGTLPGSAIMSIGAVAFDNEKISVNTFYRVIDLKTCLKAGLTISSDTLYWWLMQSDQARAALCLNKIDLKQALADFSSWFYSVDGDEIWSHGANFDIPLLDVAYSKIGEETPYKFWNARDTRTLFALSNVFPDRNKGTYHNALDDARNQAEAAIKALKILDLVTLTPVG